MYHSIEFDLQLTVDVEIARSQPLERLLINKGTRLRAEVRPYVIESNDGPVEVADLFFENGSTTRGVPFAWFSFAK